MRRIVFLVVAMVALLVLTAGPGLAAKPVGGCPNPKFTAMEYSEFRALSVAVGVPEEFLGAEHAAQWDVYDRNDDGTLCVMDLPDNPGTFFGWQFNVIDNTASR